MRVFLSKITDQIGILFEQNWTTASTASMPMQQNLRRGSKSQIFPSNLWLRKKCCFWWLTKGVRVAREIQDVPRLHQHSWCKNKCLNFGATCMHSFFHCNRGAQDVQKNVKNFETISLSVSLSLFQIACKLPSLSCLSSNVSLPI